MSLLPPLTMQITRLPCSTKLARQFYIDDIITEPFRFKVAGLDVPDRPGLGIELDPKKIEKYRVA